MIISKIRMSGQKTRSSSLSKEINISNNLFRFNKCIAVGMTYKEQEKKDVAPQG